MKRRITTAGTKGFTLAELLIAVAIIAVLAAISIPIFSSQMEKSREATDLANVRSAYAEVMTAANSDDHDSSVYDIVTGGYKASVQLVQTQKDWQSTVTDVGGVEKGDSAHWIGVPQKGGTCTVSYTEDRGVVINWSGYTYHVSLRWTHSISTNTNGVGYQLFQGAGDGNKNVTAVDQPLSGEIGQTLTLQSTDDEKLKNCQLGFFAVDPQTGIVLYDSGRMNFDGTNNSRTITNKYSDYSGDVEIYVQLINDKASTKGIITEEDAEELMQLISIK